MNIDPRDLFISLNPLGLDGRELNKDSSGFADDRTHSDYLLFLAGYKAGTVDGEECECQRRHPINAEGFKPEISTPLHDMHCADAAGTHNLNQVEGCKPDLNITLSEGEHGTRLVALEVLTERIRQIMVEGYTAEQDDQYTTGQLADAASAYAAWAHTWNLPYVECTHTPALWPWAPETWKSQSQRQMLIKAGALILAELERLDRKQAQESAHG
ncbi:hypothetical protein [Pseudomonas monteilii]|uniref:hypothetical protein n=1 Tax=Pseudomonas monteilii TaxID=76759 RepID=UPI0015FB1BA1|nr:hypothetical protein [Pseudomonas monteilii]MBA6103454.1 hypothetical protein [Pseudomonas monteilii]